MSFAKNTTLEDKKGADRTNCIEGKRQIEIGNEHTDIGLKP